MTATVKLPGMLAQAINGGASHAVDGGTVQQALSSLFDQEPGLRNHIVDEAGSIRPHVSVFVDGVRAGLGTPVGDDSEVRILHAVSGG